MPLPPPITALPIETQRAGFYQGFNQFVAVGSKVLIGLLIIWAAVFPDQAGAFLSALNSWLLAHFGHWYLYVVFSILLYASGWRSGQRPDESIWANPGKNPNFHASHGSR